MPSSTTDPDFTKWFEAPLKRLDDPDARMLIVSTTFDRHGNVVDVRTLVDKNPEEVRVAIGPGKYDDEATIVMERTRANGTVVIVIGGNKGEGFSVQGTLPVMLMLPMMLRTIADQLEADMINVKP